MMIVLRGATGGGGGPPQYSKTLASMGGIRHNAALRGIHRRGAVRGPERLILVSDRDVLIGVDLGTSSVRVVAFDLDGNTLAGAVRDYPMATPKPNWAEQDPEDWWTGTRGALRTVARAIDAGRVAGISFSGQMHGAVFLDREDEVIRPCILWCDNRTAPQCAAILETVGEQAFLDVVKNRPLPGFTLPKVVWLRDHEKANFRRLRTLLLPKDYVRFRMTGVRCMDEADGAGTVMMEVGRKRWAGRLVEQLGIDPAILPPLEHSISVVGTLTAEAARATGLKAGTPVVAGGGDQPVGAVGTGVTREGQVMISLGTSGVVFAPTAQPHVADAGGLAAFDHAVPGVSYLMGCVNSAAGALDWFVETLCAADVAEARRGGANVYEKLLAEAATVEAGAEELLFLPYLMGERTPHPDPDARGVFFGLSARHTRAHLTRAVIEGVCMALRDALTLIREKGVKVEDVRVTGGGARSRFWLQVLADVIGHPVRPIESAEGPALGAAILAGVGVSAYAGFEAAAGRAIRVGRALRPNARRAALYNEAYSRYRALYPAVRGLYVKH